MNGESLRPIIDEEIARLPDHYRSVFVLCQLQELTKADAAKQLGCPEGTVSSRLMRAREMLRNRLLARGVTLGTLAFVDELLCTGSVSAHLAQSTVGMAMKVALGSSLSTCVSSTVLHLAQGATPTMVLSKLQMAAVGVVLATGLTLGTGYVAGGWGQDKDAPKPGIAKSAVKPKQATKIRDTTDAIKSGSANLISSRIQAVNELGQVNPKYTNMFGQAMSLEEWLAAFEEKSGLTSIIDLEAFRSINAAMKMKELNEQQLTLPRMANQSTGTLLDTLLDGLRVNEQPVAATYLIRRGTLVIVPKDYIANASSTIHVSLETKGADMSIVDALEELSQDTGISIIVDPRALAMAREVRTNTSFRNVTLINAVRLLANMADLTVINIDGALYVSTPDNCKKMEEEMAKPPTKPGL